MTQATPPTSSSNKIQEQYREMLDSVQSIQLATVNADGFPTASYSPALLDEDNNFYIYISEMADHTGNLMNNGRAALMIIEDEKTADQLFARKRVSFQAKAEHIASDSPEWEKILDLYVEKYGRVASHLKSMGDFHLFRLVPANGRLVVGFGRAYSISPDLSEVEHLKGEGGQGHRPER
tara:strand:- start:964 stop:1500 length:537 start_codon:yes stop_codon:yes gene_type:complete